MTLTPKSFKCSRCKAERMVPGQPMRFSARNNAIPSHLDQLPISCDNVTRLEELTPVEEMCIARVSTHITVVRLSGGQTGFQGHYRGITINEPELRRLEVASASSQVPGGGCSIADRVRLVDLDEGQGQGRGQSQARQQPVRGPDSTSEPQRVTSSCSVSAVGEPVRAEVDMLCESLRRQPHLVPAERAPVVFGEVNLPAERGPVVFGEVNRRSPILEGQVVGMVSCAFPYLFPDGLDPLSPRTRELAEHEYYQHIIRLGGRFARHQRFTYWAMNTNLRHRFLGAGRVFLQMNSWAAGLTEVDLARMVADNDSRLVGAVSRFVQRVPGSNSYWQRQRCLIETMASQAELGTPHLFLTLSAADTYWDEVDALILNMNNLTAPANESLLERRRRRATQLNDNPNIATSSFVLRTESFFRDVLQPLWHVRDYVIRYEFQQRGSPHCHCLLWVDLPARNGGNDGLGALRERAAEQGLSVDTRLWDPSSHATAREPPIL